ncbi:MAG: flagellar biosynthetic protein FliR [Actinomycetota bacterium]|nr:flagellar biosynthetic protein FliR [Actinomycetota bacterium]
MHIDLNATWLLAFLLASVRAAAWLAVVPPFASVGAVPRMAVVGIAGGFGVLSAPLLMASGVPTDTAGLIGSLVVQVVVGVALGFSVQILVSAVSAAGSMIDLLSGVNPLPSFDPLSQSQVPLFGRLYDQVAIVCLFVSNGELLLVRGFEYSFSVNVAGIFQGSDLAGVLVGDLATFFTATLEIAAPVLVVLFAIQIALALVAKAAPQINAWWLGMPLQILLALILSAFAIRVVPPYLSELVTRSLQDAHVLLGAS